jgi:hypothetical protein
LNIGFEEEIMVLRRKLMAKRTARAKESEGGVVRSGPVQAAGSETTASAVEQRMVSFAEDLGTLLGTAEKKATGWLSQRESVAEQLKRIRDTANDLLSKLTGTGANVAADRVSLPYRR